MLTFSSQVISSTAPAPWPVHYELPFYSRSATMQLDGAGPEKVVMGSVSSWEQTLAVSVNPPFRFFRDLNGDKMCQPDEVFTVTESTSNRMLFRGVPHRLPIPGMEAEAGTIRGSTQTLLTDVEILGYSTGNRTATVKRIQSGYQGEVNISGTEYPALLTYRSLQDPIDGVILFDTNRDGSFDHFHDPWMLANGTGILAGEVWEVTTTFSGESATVQVKPYLGETGEIQVMGEGVLRAYVELTPYTSSEAYVSSRPRHSTLCLEQREDGVYRLPAGRYSFSNIWVGSPTHTETLFEASGYIHQFRIDENDSVEEYLGGPVSGKLLVKPFYTMLGYVFLDPGDSFKSSSGIRFKPTTLSLILEGGDHQSEPPGYEIRNSAGRVVTSGDFRYG